MFGFGRPDIGKMTEERDYDGLVKCLEDKDPMIRLEAAEGLAELQDGRGWRYLLEVVRRPEDPGVQALAADILGGLGHPRAVLALEDALPTARGDAAKAIRTALQDLGVTDENILSERLLPELVLQD